MIHTLDNILLANEFNKTQFNYLQSYITNGINLDLISTPPDIIHNNTYSVTQHIDAVRSRLVEYIQFGAIIQLPVSYQPSLVQPLHVIIKDGKKPRLVIDLSRNLNQHIEPVRFKYSSISDAVRLSFKGCWYAKLDLSNCFLSFPLHPSVLKYFIFALDGHHYQFIRMPFGLSPAPRICTELLSVIAFVLRHYSIIFVRYLDDFLIIGQSAELVQHQLDTAITVFHSFGLVVNPDKTEGPSQLITFLGIQLDSMQCTLSITQSRINELLSIIESIIQPSSGIQLQHSLRCHTILSLLGKFSFAAQVLPGARPFMRRMIDITKNKLNSTRIRVSTHFCLDLYYWYHHIQLWNGRQTWRQSQPFIIVSDASLQGFGFYLESIPANSIIKLPINLQLGSSFLGLWSNCHADYHSTHRGISWCELFSVLTAVLIYAPYLLNQSILLVIDNQTDVDIINRQSTRSSRLAILLRALYDITVRYNISIKAVHRPGELNILADYLSRPQYHQYQPLRYWSQHLQKAKSDLSSSSTSVSNVSSSDYTNHISFPSLCSINFIYSRQIQLVELNFNQDPIQLMINYHPLSIYSPHYHSE